MWLDAPRREVWNSSLALLHWSTEGEGSQNFESDPQFIHQTPRVCLLLNRTCDLKCFNSVEGASTI